MLLSLISVLVLLVIAFYAVWVGVLGHVNGNEGAELTVGGRVLVMGVALVAFVGAYLVYSHPRKDADTLASVPAMPSTPPDSRGSVMSESLEPAAETPVVAVAEDESGSAATELAAEQPVVAPEAADAPADDPPAAPEGLSAAAALLEARQAQPRRSSASVDAEAPIVPVVRQTEARGDVVLDASPSRATTKAVQPTRGNSKTRTKRNPVLLHVHNALGGDQQREQLTLRIEGKTVADIEVDDSRPSVTVAVPLPRPGLLHYRLEGVSESDGSTRLVGEGCIRVSDGARFAVRRQAGSRKVYLEASRVAG